MARTNKNLWVHVLLLLLVLSSCNLKDSSPSPDAFYTQAVETAIIAQTLTALAVTPTPSNTLTPPGDLTLETTNTPLITSTFTPGAPINTAIPINTLQVTQSGICDNALYVADITYPDFSEVTAGSSFIKTWRFKNLGPCTWTTSYRVVFSYVSDTGKDGVFTPPAPANFSEEVLPGETIDVSITLTAPTQADGYSVWFRLQNEKGANFGPEFWVIFVVR